MSSADPERSHGTNTGTTPIQRFVEEVVWEAARDAVRSRGDSPADDHESATRPCDRLAPEHHPASQETPSGAAPRVTINSVRTTPPHDRRLNSDHAPHDGRLIPEHAPA
jgi:hypothetical protein